MHDELNKVIKRKLGKARSINRTFYIPEEQLDNLRFMSKETNISMNYLVKLAIDALIEVHNQS